LNGAARQYVRTESIIFQKNQDRIFHYSIIDYLLDQN